MERLEDRRLMSIDSSAGYFSNSPSLFVENQGQWADASIRFMHQGDGANVALTDAGPVFELFRDVDRQVSPLPLGEGQGVRAACDNTHFENLRFSASFPGSNPATLKGIDRSQSQFNYFLGDSSAWRSNVPSFSSAAYENLYPGIDLKTWGRGDNLKYEFHVAPNADYRQISVRYAGIENLAIAEDGSLRIDLGESWGEITDDAPYIYQIIDGRETPVAGRFALIDSSTYSFSITGNYDAARELIIDPDVIWTNYLGGTLADYGYGVALDAGGNAYVSGQTASTNFSGASNSYYGGSYDAFAAKVSADGTLAWMTYLGGSDNDYGKGIFADPSGNSYIAGQTKSSDFSGAINAYKGGAFDAFAAKISPSGLVLWSTYLGGNKEDVGLGIAADADGNAYISGDTYSLNFAGANNAFRGGTFDAFAAKVAADGTIAWATYLGGSKEEYARGIAVDSSGVCFVAGQTNSLNFALATNAFKGGSFDAFAAKISAAGTIAWATYLGGSADDYGYGIALDNAGNAYASGNTSSTNFTGVLNAFNGGTHDAFLTKLSAAGSLAWAAYLGGSGADLGYGVKVDSDGNSFVVGDTSSANFEKANNAYHGGTYDAFAVKVAPAGTVLWTTYLGGSLYDTGRGLAVNDAGVTYVTGQTNSTDFAGANNAIKGSIDAFVAKIAKLSTPSLPDLAVACDSGVSSEDNITTTNNSNAEKKLHFTIGNLTVGATVTLYANEVVIGSATATGPSISFSTDGTVAFADGVYNLIAKQIEPGQPESTESPPLILTIDTVAPPQPAPPDLRATSDSGYSDSDNITNDYTPTFDVATGLYTRFFRDGQLVSGVNLTEPYTDSQRPDGSYIYKVIVKDAAGNESVQSEGLSVTIDTVAPTVAINQAQGQSDPVMNSPSNFAVVFSETVVQFTSSKLAIGGMQINFISISGSGPTYKVAISPVRSNGSLSVSLPAGAICDPAGNASAASTSTDNAVIYDGLPHVWDGGGGDDKWTTPANWVGDLKPSPGDELIFPAGAARMNNENDFPAGMQFGSIAVYGNGYHFLNHSVGSSTIIVPKKTTFSAVSIIADSLIIGVSPTFVWTGGGADNKWSTAANWQSGVAPSAGDKLEFPANAARLENVNDYPTETRFAEITIRGNGYRFSSNAIRSTAIMVPRNTTFTAASIVADSLIIGWAPTFVWTGGGADGKWTTAANWQSGKAPTPGANLEFPAGAARLENVNDFLPGMEFGSIVVADGYHIQTNSIKSSTTIEVKANSVLTATSIECDTLIIGSAEIIITPHAENGANANDPVGEYPHSQSNDPAPQNSPIENTSAPPIVAEAPSNPKADVSKNILSFESLPPTDDDTATVESPSICDPPIVFSIAHKPYFITKLQCEPIIVLAARNGSAGWAQAAQLLRNMTADHREMSACFEDTRLRRATRTVEAIRGESLETLAKSKIPLLVVGKTPPRPAVDARQTAAISIEHDSSTTEPLSWRIFSTGRTRLLDAIHLEGVLTDEITPHLNLKSD
jgi:Tfp pilus assembly protein PilZ